MFKGQKVIVVMPAYNAEKTLRKTYNEVMDQQIVDEVIIVGDTSRDATAAVAQGKHAARVVSTALSLPHGRAAQNGAQRSGCNSSRP